MSELIGANVMIAWDMLARNTSTYFNVFILWLSFALVRYFLVLPLKSGGAFSITVDQSEFCCILLFMEVHRKYILLTNTHKFL